MRKLLASPQAALLALRFLCQSLESLPTRKKQFHITPRAPRQKKNMSQSPVQCVPYFEELIALAKSHAAVLAIRPRESAEGKATKTGPLRRSSTLKSAINRTPEQGESAANLT